MTATAAKITHGRLEDLEDAAAFTPKVLLQKRRTIDVVVPRTKGKADDTIKITLQEGDWEHSLVWMTAEVKGGIPGAPLDGLKMHGGCVRVDQIERLILALQLVAAEADKVGLRKPRKCPAASVIGGINGGINKKTAARKRA